jgi:5-methylcytosine-specific restriction endonuclease McrA
VAIPAAIRLSVRQRAGFRCEYCHADERWQFVKFTIDHIVPRSLDGGDNQDNLAVWDAEGIRIVGLTPTGRATIALLDINDELHGGAALRVRYRDLLDGYHPPPNDPVLTE